MSCICLATSFFSVSMKVVSIFCNYGTFWLHVATKCCDPMSIIAFKTLTRNSDVNWGNKNTSKSAPSCYLLPYQTSQVSHNALFISTRTPSPPALHFISFHIFHQSATNKEKSAAKQHGTS